MPPNLADRLKEETRELHRAAEQSRFMQSLMHGTIDTASYCASLRQLLAIYAALEPALLRQASHPVLAPFGLSALSRCAALQSDLRDLGEGEPANVNTPGVLSPATRAYVNRLQHLADKAPTLLLAHAYVRYLGDLNGGQRIAPVVAKALGLRGSEGTSFYDFGGAARTAVLLKAFRHELGAVTLSAERADEVVAEARWSFAQHLLIFDTLATPAHHAPWAASAGQ